MAVRRVEDREYLDRVVDQDLGELLGLLPAIALEGPKAVGKTRTAERHARTSYRLDDPQAAAIVSADPALLVRGDSPVLIDEWQRMPTSWDLVRRAVDDDPSPGRFLLTGSATPSEPTHSGAGRIVTVRMRPLTLVERRVGTAAVSLRSLLAGERPPIAGQTTATLATYVDEILASGLPGIRQAPPDARRLLLDGYIDRIVEHDFREIGHVVRRPAALRRWLAAYAAATATTASYDSIRDAATSGEGDKPAKTTTGPYRDVLERLWIIDPVPAWAPTRSQLRRLTGSPKHHLADVALTARLLGLDERFLLDDGTLLGRLFESLVTLDVRVYAQSARASVHHLRERGGTHEVDLIVQGADNRIVAFEVKLSAMVDDRDVRHLHWLRGQIGDGLADAVIVTTGRYAYRRADGIAVVPAALLGR